MRLFILEFAGLLLYFIVSIFVVLIIRKWIKLPRELSRKLLHIVLLCSTLYLFYGFSTWQHAALASLVFVILVYPILALLERFKLYARALVERERGEVKRSLITAYSMYLFIILITWAWLDIKYVGLAAVFAWGFGDAAAALVGKRFGKHHFKLPFVDPKKSLEGTASMLLVSFLSVLLVLLFNVSMPWFAYFTISLSTAIVTAFVELITNDGFDTITCPFAALGTLLPLILFWGLRL